MDASQAEQKSLLVERLIKLAPVLLVIATGVFLQTGRLFHEGYVGRLHLNTTMFDADISSLASLSIRAWLDVIEHALRWVASRPAWTVALLPVALASPFVLGWGVRRWAWWTRHQRRSRRVRARKKRLQDAAERLRRRLHRHLFWPHVPGWLLFLRRTIWGVWIMGYLSYTGITFIALILISLVYPFSHVGAEAAAKDMSDHFSDQPLVTLRDPDGRTASYRIALCGSRYCALYGEGQIITVQASAITWGVSTPGRGGSALPPGSATKASAPAGSAH